MTATQEAEVTFTAGGLSVTVFVRKLEQDILKPLEAINLPTQEQLLKSGTLPKTWIIDLGRTKEVISITEGYLADESTESAFTKKQNLLSMARTQKEVTMTWGSDLRQESYLGNINQVKITENPGIFGDSQPTGYEQEKYYTVTMLFIIGDKK